MMVLTLTVYFVGKRIGDDARGSKWWLVLGVMICVSAIASFKYSGFFITRFQSFINSIGFGINLGSLSILLPLGLSFYALQGISYLVDIYRGTTTPSDSILDFSLYMAYFPKLLSGPIERAKDFLPKLRHRRIVDNERLSDAFTLLFLGLFRKLVIADSLRLIIPENIFVKPLEYPGSSLLLWLFAYVLMIYNDFAGYTDIARGVSGFFGIELSKNFAQPFFSTSFTEFWNRWHITLSHWLRDYIFMPLSRFFLRRIPNPRHLINLFIPALTTMLVSGLWHEARLSVLLWGALNGLYLGVERVVSLWNPTWRQEKIGRISGFFGVHSLALLAAVPFASGVRVAFNFYRGIVNLQMAQFHLDPQFLLLFLFSISLDAIQAISRDDVVFKRWPLLVRSSLLVVVFIALIFVSSMDSSEPFVYQGF